MPLPCIPALLSTPHTAYQPSDPGPSHSAPYGAGPPLSNISPAPHLRSNIPSNSSHLQSHQPSHRTSYWHSHSSPISMNCLLLPPSPLSPTPSGHEWDPAVLICRFVGFPLILDKCPYLKSKVCVTVVQKSDNNSNISDGYATGMQIQVPVLDPPRSYKDWVLQQKSKEESLIRDRNRDGTNGTAAVPTGARSGVGVICSTMICSNSLVCVSKGWSAACKAALCLEWRRGSCAEWRVVSELMSSDRVTKVSPSLRGCMDRLYTLLLCVSVRSFSRYTRSP